METSLPENWAEVQLEECMISLESGSRPKGGVRGISEGIPSIGGEHLNDSGGFDFSNIKYVPLQFASKMNRGQIQLGDVLIVKDGATTGKTSFVNENFPYPNAVVNEHVFICRINPEINSKYLFYFLWSKEGKEKILENFKGSAQGGINTGFISNLLVPIAPKTDQDRIVAKLDAIMQKVEANKQRLEKIPKLLKRFRQAVLLQAFSGVLSDDWRAVNSLKANSIISFKQVEKSLHKRKRSLSINEHFIKLVIPESWTITNLDSVSDVIVDCPHSTPKWSDSGKICLRTSNFLPNRLNLEEIKYVSESVYNYRIERLKPKLGDILYSREGGILGIACMLNTDEDVCLGQRMMLFRLNENVDKNFICYFLNSPIILEHVRSLTGGSAAPHINVADIKEFPIPFPPLDEQNEIVLKIEQLFAFADKIESRYLKAKAMLDRLPRSVLRKAFRGELS